MKVYYLHLINSDFTVAGNVWTSGVIDLYYNTWYKNYSATKSNYGLNLLGDRTWTGMEELGTNLTDAGEIQDGRFIDYTGRIDLMNHNITINGLPGEGLVDVNVQIYTIDDPLNDFPDEWAQRNDVSVSRPILWINTNRYVRFALEFDTPQNISNITIEYNVRVEIDKPVMNPLYRRTSVLLRNFPEWMKVREDSGEYATPALAKAGTLAGQLVNAVAGEWLDSLDADIEYIRMQRFIKTADVDQVAWVWHAASVPSEIYTVVGDGNYLTNTADLTEFYEADIDDDVFYWDEFAETVYVRKNYNIFQVNSVNHSLAIQQIWNWFDEHGAIVDLIRHEGESNESYQSRILDVYINTPGVALESFKKTVRRELNLWKAYSATPELSTPNSYYAGATPTVLEIQDIEELDEFITPDGMPTAAFIDLVEELAEAYPITWGYFRWNQALWDVGGDDGVGFGILPYRYDASPATSLEIQSGIGDGPDLFVYRPDEITGPREFNYRLRVRGRQRIARTEYPKITINANIYGRADKTIFNNPTQTPWFTYVITTPAGVFRTSVQATVTSDADNGVPVATPNSYYYYALAGPDGNSRTDQIWYDAGGNAYSSNSATPFVIDYDTITDSYVQWGKWNPAGSNYTDYPTTGSVTMWFANNPAATPTSLNANNSNTQLAPTDDTNPGTLVIKSNVTSSSLGLWESEPQPFTIEINGALPNNSIQNNTISVPNIIWDPNLFSVPNKKYIVELTNTDQSGNYVVISKDATGNLIFLPKEVVGINGNFTWTVNEIEFSAISTSTLTFSSTTNITPPYPLDISTWDLFEAEETELRFGVVDENGPWREGRPQEEGAFNFLLEQADVGRADFGLSDDEDIVITWIGVDVINNNRVLAWLDSNVVNPATDDENEVDYPATAVNEVWSPSAANYVFEPFFIRARMRPDIEPQWYPQVHSGWYYQRNKDYYLYANPITQAASGPFYNLNDVARQGAPIIVKTKEATPKQYRHVAFYDDATPVLSLINKEVLYGTNHNVLFVAYEDVFDVSVKDLETGTNITASVSSSTNEISTSIQTFRDKQYEVTYKVNRSFVADNEYINSENKNVTRITATQKTAYNGFFDVTYEGSDYDPATPVDLPLNTFYTTMDEGFIFLSHDEYDLKYVEAYLSPSKLYADGEDYTLVSIRSYDIYGNPKGNKTFTLTTTFGTFEKTGTNVVSLTTDTDGFATTHLIAGSTFSSYSGHVYVDGPGLVDATINYEIDPLDPQFYRLIALPSSDAIPADGQSKIIVYGKVENTAFDPVPYAAVAWKRDRSMAKVFTKNYQGQVIADHNGRFSIGPITSATPSEPGYWFLMMESWHQGASPARTVANPNYGATPYTNPQYQPTGDVVFWNEFAPYIAGINNTNQLPIPPIQNATPAPNSGYYPSTPAYPVTYDQATPTPVVGATPPIPVIPPVGNPPQPSPLPPCWYAIDRYTQYQLGLLGRITTKIVRQIVLPLVTKTWLQYKDL